MSLKAFNSVNGYSVGDGSRITNVIDANGNLLNTSSNILYVATNGNDSNNGNINNPFLTIKAAMAAATTSQKPPRLGPS